MSIRLITGGIRSGKSHFAEELCVSLQEEVIYIATSPILDEEMTERITKHQARRPANWGLIEEEIELAKVIKKTPASAVLLIECISTWVSNHLFTQKLEEKINREIRQAFLEYITLEVKNLLASLHGRQAILVTNEVGLGGISMHPVGRLFQDALGEVNQYIAQEADEVWLVVSGIPWRVKG
ncbi:bifunctional adenosylcobinamide kinase/adenosylcobinamide-phosphate guanylyltransferase [Thermoflavimicrobium daqui]|jgi:adenosylcobinamide kinase/adenosylcobinamide-phosphate guanylyltransferase|uniref:Adenosylcobinamide kinase n=1 Tax=Thermoflavimicrobium daqui TaxID=2137476 RepID=A0A364K603_9BACL|nr:bifunctional adenosylcobinamide kinase/adenosylcobinamide-phosphate guanylyltransferase [Thermoflavimicrobium daqui]RAL25620.1 bifunctional adenosylcobinamide kinase/adenosylcobinamide-phosphate guanylyltransferase [Thermoflavimicrobium daqui]